MEVTMKISDLLSVLQCETVTVACNGLARELDTRDPLMMAAYGDFIVQSAYVYVLDGKPMCEVSVKTAFCKAG